jgi:hypothetical protein
MYIPNHDELESDTGSPKHVDRACVTNMHKQRLLTCSTTVLLAKSFLLLPSPLASLLLDLAFCLIC